MAGSAPTVSGSKRFMYIGAAVVVGVFVWMTVLSAGSQGSSSSQRVMRLGASDVTTLNLWPSAAELEEAEDKFWRRVRVVEGSDDPEVIGCKVVSYSPIVENHYGDHRMCEFAAAPGSGCLFHSYGISTDFTFDELLAGRGCTGMMMDPTVNLDAHPGGHASLTFLPLGANAPKTVAGFGAGSVDADAVQAVSVPGLAKTLGHTHLTVLKMDCEGCEFGLAADVARDDPSFFERVDNFALEVHLCENIMPTKGDSFQAARDNLNALFVFLERAGHELRDSYRQPCDGTTPPLEPPLADPRWLMDRGCCMNFAWSKSQAQ